MRRPLLPPVFARHAWVSAMAFGLALTVAQILVACFVQGRGPVPQAYRSLFRWDSIHYGHLVENGYFNTLPPLIGDTDPGRGSYLHHTNVAFFPGYILAGRAVRAVTGFSPVFSLLLAAALAAWAFWAQLIVLLRHWKISGIAQSVTIAAIIVHPTAFYLVAAYSESLFLLGIIGFILWSDGRTITSYVSAIVHGIIMTATRIFGLPLCAYPLVVSLLRREHANGTIKAGLIAVGASIGALLFFLFSSLALGKWNLYMLVQEKQWALVPDYFFLLHPPLNLWLPIPPAELFVNNAICPVATSLTLWLLLGAAVAEWFSRSRDGNRTRPERVALLLCAALSMYVSLIPLAGAEMRSMVRYAFIPYVFIVLQLALLSREFAWTRTGRIAVGAIIVAVLGALLWTQMILLGIFTAGGWVA